MHNFIFSKFDIKIPDPLLENQGNKWIVNTESMIAFLPLIFLPQDIGGMEGKYNAGGNVHIRILLYCFNFILDGANIQMHN